MSYLGELRQHWRSLVAASLGVGTSLPLFAYTNSVFAPHLISDFGWSRAQFALIGITMLVTLPFLPVFGRIGARPLNGEEQQKMYLRDGNAWKVSDDPFDRSLYRWLKDGVEHVSPTR